MAKWQGAMATVNAIEQCPQHKDRMLELFCEDHDQLLCTICHVRNHKNCSQVVLIADKLKAFGKEFDLGKITANIQTLQNEFIKKKTEKKNAEKNLDKSNQALKVSKSMKQYNVRMKDDSKNCMVSGFCETDNGELLVLDWINKKVKLLDQAYTVVANYILPGTAFGLCYIGNNQVAVPITYYQQADPISDEIHIIKVTCGQLVQVKKLKFQHSCLGIAHHQDNLFITTGTALYHYTMNGTLVSKVYQDTSGFWIASCGVSPDGGLLYLAKCTKSSEKEDQLVTLSRDGTVISTFTDPSLDWKGNKPGIHVTDQGQVLVCGDNSGKIIR